MTEEDAQRCIARAGSWYELRLLFKPDADLPTIDPLRLAEALAPVLGAGRYDQVFLVKTR
jgi:hypothetical protein